ncbi:XRE family transcriptional regulator [Polyangium fumosum]|uniref:XRE family transcriptional regulator n=2 Tax=Polyangium TaxID=55 RepID=A0A4U1IU47_9BACT|nr:XRE family transcriptional regulator [Polyangium fumosum]
MNGPHVDFGAFENAFEHWERPPGMVSGLAWMNPLVRYGEPSKPATSGRWSIACLAGKTVSRCNPVPTRRVPDPLAAHIGARMRELRREKGMSLSQFAKASGLSKGHASNLENGLALMSVGTVFAVARALGVPPFLLCMREEDESFAACLDKILREEGGDVGRAAVRLRELFFGRSAGPGRGQG